MAETLITTFRPLIGRKHPIEEIVLLPSGNGRYEVTIDGELVYSKAETGKHTTNDYIIQKVRARLNLRSQVRWRHLQIPYRAVWWICHFSSPSG